MCHQKLRTPHQKLRVSQQNQGCPNKKQGYRTKNQGCPTKSQGYSTKTQCCPTKKPPKKPQEHPAQGLGGDTCPPPPSFSQPLPHRSSLALRALGHPASQNLPPRGTDSAEMRNPNASPEEAELLPGVSGWGQPHHCHPSCPRAAAGGRHREPCVVRGGGRRLASRIRLHPPTALDQGAGSQAVGV